MKKTFLFLLLTASVCLISGCCSSGSYDLTLLGDIHYDGEKYHDMSQFGMLPEGRKVAKNAQLNKDGYFSYRCNTLWMTKYRGDSRRNLPKNIEMWKKYMPQLLKEAGDSAAKNRSLYAVQLGDMIHGDCGHLHLHKANLQDGLDVMKEYFTCPVLTICGNHDTRGVFGQQAWNEVVNPHLDKATGYAPRKNANYYFNIGKDLYYFHDMMNPDLDFLEEALQKNKNARYKFFISHAPVIPESRRQMAQILTDDVVRLIKLLESADAIIISGHTHSPALVEYKNPENERQMTQFILNSTVWYPNSQLAFKINTARTKGRISNNAKTNMKIFDRYFDGKIKTLLSTSGTGFATLRVSDDGVFADYKNLAQDKIHTFKLR